MIVPMQKYTFLVFHKEYDSFLNELQELGVLHIVEKKDETTELRMQEMYKKAERIEKAVNFLQKREIKKEKSSKEEENLTEKIEQKQQEIQELKQILTTEKKALEKAKPWGAFSHETIGKLKNAGIEILFFSCSSKKYKKEWENRYYTEKISEQNNKTYFVVLKKTGEKINIEAEEENIPKKTGAEIEIYIKEIKSKIEQLNADLDEFARSSIDQLIRQKNEIISTSDYQKVKLNTLKKADDKLMLLEGWIAENKQKEAENFFETNKIFFVSEKPKKEDDVPILLKNNKFSKLFEPIGELFSLPNYSELDLTVFFAPFFMMFFGFCLGDAGYGLLFVIGAAIYKRKADKEIKPYLSLIQLLGIATFIFGTISGTLFGVNLIETPIAALDNYRELFLNPDNMFNLALILGGIQIVFGMAVKASNQIKQYGFSYALATFGWIIALVGNVAYFGLTKAGIIAESKPLIYAINSIGGILILFFNDPEVGIPARIGKGVWDIYSTVTGVFGDLLSYIRLFALGLSSAILGFVINDIAIQILGSSAILGPVFFVIFLLAGHTLNILISSLGSFVHPMRLTFVEFYKNAGFTGGGKEYKPFQKNK